MQVDEPLIFDNSLVTNITKYQHKWLDNASP